MPAVIRLRLRRGSSRGRRLTARISPRSRGRRRLPASRPSRCWRFRSLRGTFTRAKRVGNADGDADQPLELLGEPAAGGAAAGDEDLADAERAGLLLVEAERGDELAGEDLQLGGHRPARLLGAAGVEAGGLAFLAQRKRALDRLGLRGSEVEHAGERDVERRAAPGEDARELADAPVRDGEGRAVVADRDADEPGVLGRGRGRSGSPRARRSANASRSIPTSFSPAFRQAAT